MRVEKTQRQIVAERSDSGSPFIPESPTTKPHVLHVIPTLGVGGMELALTRIVRGLTQRRIRHTIAYLRGAPKLRDQFDKDVEIHTFRSRANEWTLSWGLRRLIRQVRPTVIHARNWGAWPDVALARFLVRPRVPLVFSFHGVDTAGPMMLRPRHRVGFRFLARITTCVFTVSEGAKRFLVEQVGLSPNGIDVIPNGIDTERFRPRTSRPAGARLIVGTVGGLRAVKNHVLLIQSCAALVAAGIDVELRIAGDGVERANLERSAAELSFSKRLRLAGQIADVPGFLHGLDIFVLPSDSEAHPNSLLEAMSCALPCVATRVGGVPEVLNGSQAGILVNPGDRDAIVGALRELAGSAETRERLGQTARSRICRDYGIKRMIDAYEELYNRLTCRPKNPRHSG